MNDVKMKIRGNWNVLKGKAKKEWAHLTDDDLQYAEGQEDVLLGNLQRKTGETMETIGNWINKNV